MEKRILFMDMDNTLLTTDKTITPENDAAIRRALLLGHQIVICSGRPLVGIISLARSLHLTDPGCFIIAFNGALIYDCGADRALYRSRIPMADVRILFDQAARHGLYIHTYGREGVLIRKECEESRFYLDRIHAPFRVIPGLPDGLDEEPEKALLIELHDKNRLDRYRRETDLLVGDRLSLFYSNDYLLECVRKGTSKGAAVKWLCNYLDIPIENSVAAGDAENDISMLEAAGTGCAMQNAAEACKNAADYITKRDCNHSGVAEIIDKFIIADEIPYGQSFHQACMQTGLSGEG